jgi:serine protease
LLFDTSWADISAKPNGAKSMAVSKMEPLPVNQIIIKYKAWTGFSSATAAGAMTQMQRLSNAAGVTLGYFRPMSGEAHVLRLPQRMDIGKALDVCARLAAMSDVEYVEPDYIMQPLATPNDPQYTNQWHYLAPAAGHYGVNAPTAWDITTGSASIYAAVIDTGILDHADLSGRWVGGYDFITDPTTANDGGGRDADPHDPGDWVVATDCGGTDPSDSSWHGTHVAGTIGAASNNSVGVAGLNWVSKVVPLRVLGKCGGYTSDIADAMRWSAGLTVSGVPANPYPAKVVNMSLGGAAACSTTYQDAIDAMNAAGTVLVVAAGNSNTDASGFTPANCNGVITVAATNRAGSRSYYSNYGSVVEVAAPGGETNVSSTNGILSTLNTGTTSPASDTYAYYQGTSMAAPHVTGVVSLMFSVNPSLTPTQVLNILQSTVTPFPAGSTCITTYDCGSGIVNAQAAVAMAQSVTGPPTVISTTPANGATGVEASTTIKAVFSKLMNAATITTSTFTLSGGVSGSVTYDPATYTATFTPSASLAYNTTYTATITTGVTDSGGVHMAANKVWSFKTGAEVLTLLTEGFTTAGLPAGWTVTDNAGTGAVWVFNDPELRGNLTGGAGGFAIADSDNEGEVNMDTELRTPLLDLSNFSNPVLKFKTSFISYESEVADVDVSINGASGPWTNVWHKSLADYTGSETVDISSLAEGEANVMIRFRYYNANWDWYWEVDDVVITAINNPLLPPVRIPGVGEYDSLQAAYNSAPSSCTIQAQAMELPSGSLTMGLGKTILIEGGYDASYSSNSSGFTTMTGALTLGTGTLTVENLIIK